jgi:hypothetical protein
MEENSYTGIFRETNESKTTHELKYINALDPDHRFLVYWLADHKEANDIFNKLFELLEDWKESFSTTDIEPFVLATSELLEVSYIVPINSGEASV